MPAVGRGRRPVGSGVPVVALGGGHGLAVTLRALRGVTDQLTAIVGMADDGGSSGRLRREIGVPPPGDLRMALAALCGDDVWGRTWSSVVQHRFHSGELSGQPFGFFPVASGLDQPAFAGVEAVDDGDDDPQIAPDKHGQDAGGQEQRVGQGAFHGAPWPAAASLRSSWNSTCFFSGLFLAPRISTPAKTGMAASRRLTASTVV